MDGSSNGKRAFNVCVNGFGRMGRLSVREILDRASSSGEFNLNLVLINESCGGGARTGAHLLEFDSVHGRWKRGEVSYGVDNDREFVAVSGTKICFTSYEGVDELPLEELGVDLVLECTGNRRTVKSLEPYEGRVKRVVVSAPLKGNVDPSRHLDVVYGVNDNLLTPEHTIVTAASCTTNCIAPVVQAIHDSLGITHGLITTIHNVTNTQVVVDACTNMKKPGDLRRTRSALVNLAPTSTGSATAITKIIPELKGKLNGLAVRVPLINASLTDCVFEVGRETTREEVNSILQARSEQIPSVLGVEEQTLVSTDYINDPRSGVVDAASTMVVDGTMVKVYVWYDNEYGYAIRMVDVAAKVASLIIV